MAQLVRGVFDLGGARAVADPRQDEARAREAGARAEKDLKSQMAARLVNAQQQQQAVNLQRQQMAQQESQFSRGQQFSGTQAEAQRAWEALMRREGFAHESTERGLDRGQQESQFGRQFAFGQERARVGDQQWGQQFQAGRDDRKSDVDWRTTRSKVEDDYRNREFNQRDDQFRIGEGNRLAMTELEILEQRRREAAAQGLANRDAGREAVDPILSMLQGGERIDSEHVQALENLMTIYPERAPEILRILDATQSNLNRRVEERRQYREGEVPHSVAGWFADDWSNLFEQLGLKDDAIEYRQRALEDRDRIRRRAPEARPSVEPRDHLAEVLQRQRESLERRR